MFQISQPLFAYDPEPGHLTSNVWDIQTFIQHLRAEEDYYPHEINQTKTNITRLRKIFYDEWGWNDELIRGAADIPGRYEVQIIEGADLNTPTGYVQTVSRHQQGVYEPKHRMITYAKTDRIYPERHGQVPPIYALDHQEVRLADGFMCDVAHVLAGLDAYNHPQMVTPFPNSLFWLARFFPHVKSNMDVVTWLGDIASSAGGFLFDTIQNNQRPITLRKEQAEINAYAPASDMLGDLDAYAISVLYQEQISSNDGMRVSDILEDYYLGSQNLSSWRCSIFCHQIGLQWDGQSFVNKNSWLKNYKKELKSNTLFQVYSLTDQSLKSLWLPLILWFGAYKQTLKLTELLEIFMESLADGLRNESPLPPFIKDKLK